MPVARVLLVDDDPTVRNTIKELLAREGHEVISASSGGVAMRHFEELPAKVLIANVYMAEGDGIKFVAEMNRIEPELKIIALAPSPVPQGYLSAAKAFGASEIFLKPVDTHQLLRVVRRLLR
jgi:DNA-binding NtrC family response regulator